MDWVRHKFVMPVAERQAMKYGFLSDCHGNIQGLKRAYDVLVSYGAKKFICLGDVVGYGANSAECIEFLESRFDIVLAGNHDHALIEKCSMAHYQSYAIESLILTRSQLKKSHIDYLMQLPLEKTFEENGLRVHLTHAHPKDPENWCYYPEDPEFSIVNEGEDLVGLCFYGHTHQAKFCVSSQSGEMETPENFVPHSVGDKSGETLVINVGSCGQPRDGDTRVCGLILDTNEKTFTFVRGEYPIEDVQLTMRELGLSEYLIERLNYGR